MPSVDPGYKYAWLIWSAAFLVPWALLFVARPALRRRMLWSSVLTAPFGLTEPLFVPEYWNPPSLFDLAHRTGFDIESLVFSFAIGGLAVAGYRALAPATERSFEHAALGSARHRWHTVALLSPFIVFVALLPVPWNPIYAGIGAMLAGAVATLLCRPDLLGGTLRGDLFSWRSTPCSCSASKACGRATSKRCGTCPTCCAGGRWAWSPKNCCSALSSACTGAACMSTSPGGKRLRCQRSQRVWACGEAVEVEYSISPARSASLTKTLKR